MLRTLLVDDEPYIVQGLSVLIDWGAEGCEIVGTAANGREAMTFLKNNEVDLVITDIKMPVMTGLELLEAIRKEGISEAYFVILSGHKDFQYAREAIRYNCMDFLLKPIRKEELTEVLRKAAGRHEIAQREKKEGRRMEKAYLSRNVISLLSGKFDQVNLEYVKKHMKLSSGVRYIDIEIDVRELPEDLPEAQMRALQRRLYQKCMAYLGEEDSSHCIFDVSNKEHSYDIGLVFCRRMAEEKGVGEQEYLDGFLKHISKSMDVPVVMFVGSEVEDIAELSESYQTAAVVKSFQAYRAYRDITYYEEEIRKDPSGAMLCKQSLDGLILSIEQNDRKGIDRNVDSLYGEMESLGIYADLVDLNISYLLFHLIHLASEQDDNVNQEEIMRYISAGVFSRKNCVGGGKINLKHFACEYAEYLAQLRKHMSRGVLAQIEREVREHYAENLTLKELSKKYYVNSAYLGQVFRKKYGQPFKDYLNSYRMEQAIAMLLHTDMKVYEIAEAVGYHDLDYFINRFIAVKGCTPAKFRKQSRE